jgi:hypothetical protein
MFGTIAFMDTRRRYPANMTHGQKTCGLIRPRLKACQRRERAQIAAQTASGFLYDCDSVAIEILQL